MVEICISKLELCKLLQKKKKKKTQKVNTTTSARFHHQVIWLYGETVKQMPRSRSCSVYLPLVKVRTVHSEKFLILMQIQRVLAPTVVEAS